MNVLIIGSGTSAVTAAKTFLEFNYKVYLIDSGNFKDNLEYKKKNTFFPNFKNSPKFQNKPLINSIKKFKREYKIKTKNFFLTSALLSGGLSNYWGGGLEIPPLEYLKKYSFGKLILKEKDFINQEIGISRNNFKFYEQFYKQKIIQKFLKKKNKTVYFSKQLLAVKQFKKKNFKLSDYNNVDLLNGYNRKIYNAKFEIKKLIKNKNFKYIPNTFVKNIKKSKTKFLIQTNKEKFLNLKLNKIIISCGTVGSTILVDRILGLSDKYQIFHTPIVKIIYYSFTLPLRVSRKIKFGLPLLNLNIFFNNQKFCGSFMQMNNISNSFFGISKFNFFFSFIKKFFFVGNIFLPPQFSNSFIQIKNNKSLIYSKNNLNKEKVIFKIKQKLKLYLKKFNLNEFNLQNFKFLENGSDAHYTSTLVYKKINGKNILKQNCELNGFKNIHVLDGSSIKEGLYYPNYFLMMFVRFVSKKIIIYDKKNKNKYKY